VIRRKFLFSAGSGLALFSIPPLIGEYKTRVIAETLTGTTQAPPLSLAPFMRAEPWAQNLVDAALTQVGETVRYDGSYVRLAYPGGDIPRDTGVCTDVVIRAYRDAFCIDLQKLVHEDMRKNFNAYPKTWGLKRTDRNIDHRRVPNLEMFFTRNATGLEITQNPQNYQPGDLVTLRLPGNLPHIVIVTHMPSRDGKRPLVVHNIGAGTRVEDTLFDFRVTGHYRYNPLG